MTARDEPCVEPVHDTWRPWTGAARWTWAPAEEPSGDDRAALNPWVAGRVARLLDAIGALARIRHARLDGPVDGPPIVPGELSPAGDQPIAAFERAVIDAIRDAAAPVVNLDLELDLRLWIRTAEEKPPRRGWVARAATVSLFNRAQHPDGSLRVDHTLFTDGALHGATNHELHELNQPLLRDLLAAIAAHLGPIVEVEGLPGVDVTGFAAVAASVAPIY